LFGGKTYELPYCILIKKKEQVIGKGYILMRKDLPTGCNLVKAYWNARCLRVARTLDA
jgi:hypothetical protein